VEKRRAQRESHRSTHYAYPAPISSERGDSPKSQGKNIDGLASSDSGGSAGSNYCFQSNDDYLRALGEKKLDSHFVCINDP
jgi:hypothetical protein